MFFPLRVFMFFFVAVLCIWTRFFIALSSSSFLKWDLLRRSLRFLIRFRSVERRITAIRAIREAEAEGYRTSLRSALSMLSEEVKEMALSEFVKRFCPDREYVKDPDSGIVKLIPKLVSENPNFLVPSNLKRVELNRESQRRSMVQPTPRSFPICESSGKARLSFLPSSSLSSCLPLFSAFLLNMDELGMQYIYMFNIDADCV